MKKARYFTLIVIIQFICTNLLYGQFKILKDKTIKVGAAQAAKSVGVDKLLKQPAAITTGFEDVNLSGAQMPDSITSINYQPLYLLPKYANGGFILCEGYYEMTNKSYCLKAGTFAPSKGDGYMFAPTKGPKENLVIEILKSAEKHPEVLQQDIQVLLWTIIARTRFADYTGKVKITALQLLTPGQLLQLEGGVIDVLPKKVVEKAKEKLPNDLKIIFEAENNIRQMIASGNYTYDDLEKYAILAEIAAPRADVPSGIWTLHPDGYYVRYFPAGYSVTKVQVYVPKGLVNNLKNGKPIIYDATNDIACPANTGSQRLAQTNEPLKPDYTIKLNNVCEAVK
jgi:hypothetical protein